MINPDTEKDARQSTLSNVSKLSTYQFISQVYSIPKKGLWQRLKGVFSHE